MVAAVPVVVQLAHEAHIYFNADYSAGGADGIIRSFQLNTGYIRGKFYNKLSAVLNEIKNAYEETVPNLETKDLCRKLNNQSAKM